MSQGAADVLPSSRSSASNVVPGRPLVVVVTSASVEVVVASVPSWVETAIHDADDSRQQMLDTADFLESTDDPVFTHLGTEQLTQQASELRAAAEETAVDLALCVEVAALEPAQQAAHPRFRQLVVDTLANRAARALRWRGRRRAAITREVVLVVLREELALRGGVLGEAPEPCQSPNNSGPGD